MKHALTIALFFLSLPAAAQQITTERQAGMLPFVARDRERAMNDDALCQGDLTAEQKQVADLQKQLTEAKAELEKLKGVAERP